MGGIPIAKRTRFRDGVEERCCSRCEEWKPRAGGFPKTRGVCQACITTAKRRYREEGRINDGPTEHRREVVRRWNRANAEKRRAQHRRYLAGVKADPARLAKHLEGRRIAYRLRREREGKVVTRTPKAMMSETGTRYIASGPLVALVLQVHEQRGDEATLSSVCDDLGVPSRTFRRWQTEGSRTRIGLAERVVLNAGAEWDDVYGLHAEVD